MNPARIAAVMKRIVLQLRRDHRTLGLIVVVPAVVLSLLAYLFRLEPGNIPLALVAEEATLGEATVTSGPLLARLVQELEDRGGFEVQTMPQDEAHRSLEQGAVKAVIVFPKGYARSALIGQAVSVEVLLEGSNPQASGKIMSSLTAIIPSTLLRLARPGGGESNPADGKSQGIRVEYLYGGPDFDRLDYFAPAFISLFAFMFVFLLTAVSFLRERAQGTIERLLASPLTRAEAVLGYMLGFGVFAFLQSLVILLFSVFVLGIHYRGNLGIVFIVVLILAMGGVNLGIFVSAFARNELQAVQFMPLVLVPQILLSGIFFPVEDMHRVFQAVAHVMPLAYAINALRDVMIKGSSLGDSAVLLNLLALVVFAIVMVLLGTLTLQREVTA